MELKICFVSGVLNNRRKGGFPEWAKVSQWLDTNIRAPYPAIEQERYPEVKNPEIPVLENYDTIPGDSFWRSFPKRELPERVETRVNVLALKKRIWKAKETMMKSEFTRAKKVLKHLQFGASHFR